jgi:hypothetical protein
MLSFRKSTRILRRDTNAREIAERCSAGIVAQLSMAAHEMSVAELRGYARAFAWPLICAELVGKGGNDLPSADVAARALEQTVHLVTRACLAAPIAPLPMPHIDARAA